MVGSLSLAGEPPQHFLLLVLISFRHLGRSGYAAGLIRPQKTSRKGTSHVAVEYLAVHTPEGDDASHSGSMPWSMRELEDLARSRRRAEHVFWRGAAQLPGEGRYQICSVSPSAGEHRASHSLVCAQKPPRRAGGL